MADVDKLKSEGKYYEAGLEAFKVGMDNYYGCHYGMRSTRMTAIEEFRKGWEHGKTLQKKVEEPKLTPLEALQKLRVNDPHLEDGYKYYLDGPMMTPTEFLTPWAEKDDAMWCIEGETPDEGINTETRWWRCPDLY